MNNMNFLWHYKPSSYFNYYLTDWYHILPQTHYIRLTCSRFLFFDLFLFVFHKLLKFFFFGSAFFLVAFFCVFFLCIKEKYIGLLIMKTWSRWQFNAQIKARQTEIKCLNSFRFVVESVIKNNTVTARYNKMMFSSIFFIHKLMHAIIEMMNRESIVIHIILIPLIKEGTSLFINNKGSYQYQLYNIWNKKFCLIFVI